MIFDVVSRQMLEFGTVLRVFSPVGIYWKENFTASNAAYVNEGDLIFTACHFDVRPHEGGYYSEADEPTLDELRLMASLV